MKFIHIPSKLQELSTSNIDGKRFYHTPNGNYPSITTVFSAFPKPELTAWRNKIGNEAAEIVMRQASTKGTNVHLLCEKYLNNEIIDKKKFMPLHLEAFYNFKGFIDNINNIHALEAPLYSDYFKVAGRCDAIAEYKNELSIIDFKTSSKEKKEEWIQDYFLQTQFYALAYEELTGIKVKNLVVLITVNEGASQEFIKNNGDYIEPLKKKINNFYSFFCEKITRSLDK